MDEIRDVKHKIINANNKIQELTRIVDLSGCRRKRRNTYFIKTKILYVYILVHYNCDSYICYDNEYD